MAQHRYLFLNRPNNGPIFLHTVCELPLQINKKNITLHNPNSLLLKKVLVFQNIVFIYHF